MEYDFDVGRNLDELVFDEVRATSEGARSSTGMDRVAAFKQELFAPLEESFEESADEILNTFPAALRQMASICFFEALMTASLDSAPANLIVDSLKVNREERG